MAITNNYNTEPYYDDFNPDDDKNFHRILFRPGVSVQARELTQLQTILQNQIARHGEHFFKEGAAVTGAEFGFTNKFHAVKLNPTNGTQSVETYLDELLDLVVRGSKSGIEARIVHVEPATAVDPTTIYVNYVGSGIDGKSYSFQDDESLLWQRTDEDIAANTIDISGIAEGNPLAVTIPSNATSDGSSASIESGVIFAKGNFVYIEKQRIILSKYTSDPTARIGLEISESTVSADEDQSLLDTALNAPNYAARGADRYVIELKLVSKPVTDTTSDNFIELQRVAGGLQQAKAKTSEYDVLGDNLARRTHDESGDYTIKPYELQLKETLDDGINQGVYSAGTTTDSGELASNDSMTLQVSSGKSYVKGFELTTTAPSFLDIPKPRTFESIEDATTVVQVGNYVELSNVSGMPETVGDTTINEYELIELKKEVSGSSSETIGVARARDFITSAALDTDSNDILDANAQFNCYLFDIKMFSKINISVTAFQAAAVAQGTLITGETSGATAYIHSTDATGIYVTSVSGNFFPTEKLISSNSFETNGYLVENADTTDHLTVSSVTSFAFENVKSLFQADAVHDFEGDVVLDNLFTLDGSVTVHSATVTGFSTNFLSQLQVGDALLLPSGSNQALETRYVASITNNNSLTLNAHVSNNLTVAVPLIRIRAGLKDQEKNLMLRLLDKPFVKTLKTTVNNFQPENDVVVSRQFQGQVGASGLALTGATGDQFKAKSNVNYQVTVLSQGTASIPDGSLMDVEELTFSGEGTNQVTISGGGLAANSVIRVNACLQKQSQKEKSKSLQKSALLRVSNKSAQNSGNLPYGTSAHHKEISLGVADIYKVVAIYDSGTPGTDASPPSVAVSSTVGSFSRNEQIRGSESGALGLVLTIGNTVEFVSLNGLNFQIGETITGQTTSSTAVVQTVAVGSRNITNRFKYDTGQRDNYYDIGKLILKNGQRGPEGDLYVIYDYFTHGFGNFFTVDSYVDIHYKDIPAYTSTRIDPESPMPTGIFDLRSSLDFRPRVANAAATITNDVRVVTGYSFNINSRNFSPDSNSGASTVNTVRDNSNFNFDYEYYLARRDSVYLTTDGEFVVIQGNDSENPKYPDTVDNAMRLADISMPPYVADVRDVSIKTFSNKRFTMKDISTLEKRINNIEYYTSLNLLEVSANTLQVKDENGLDRFKSGFLVDNFGGHKTGDVLHPDYRCAIDMYKRILRPKYVMKNITLEEKAVTDDERLSAGYVVTNGDLAMLPYTHVTSIEQKFASTIENLNPVLNFGWTGTMTLSPSSDEWFEINRLPDLTVNVEGNFDTLIAQNADALGTVWDAATTNWTGITTTDLVGPRIRENTGNFRADFVRGFGRRVLQQQQETELGVQTRNGIETNVIEQVDITSNGDQLRSTAIIPYMRQKEITFEGNGLRPHTQVYPFFDNVDVSDYCIRTSGAIAPKPGATVTRTQEVTPAFNTVRRVLISFDKNNNLRNRISLARNIQGKLNGSYSTVASVLTSARNTTDRDVMEFLFDANSDLEPNEFGELFLAFTFSHEDNRAFNKWFQLSEIQFFNENYSENPNLSSGNPPPEGFPHTSVESWNLYNSLIDSTQFAEVVKFNNMKNVENLVDGGAQLAGYLIDGINYRSDHSGYSEAQIVKGVKKADCIVKLRGGVRTVDYVENLERFISNDDIDPKALMTDASGHISGIFQIPDPNVVGNPQFRTGTRLLRLTSSDVNTKELVDTFAQSNYTASGILNTVQETFTATRNGRVETRQVQENTEVSRSRDLGLVQVGWYDPLAQSIMPSVPGGEFITKIDVFFSSKDESAPVTIQLREMENGLPTRNVLPHGSKTLYPDNVVTSQVGANATTFEFDSPVYVKENQEICIVLMTDSIGYTAWISRLGDKDINGVDDISEQPYLGVLFKSQNNSTWTAYDYEDLKFTVYRAEFDTGVNGVVTLENQEIPDKLLESNPVVADASSSILRINHKNHQMYSGVTGQEDLVKISGVSSGISGELKTSITDSATSFVIENVTNAMPTSGQHYFAIRSTFRGEYQDEIILGTVSESGGDYTVSSLTRGIGGSPISPHTGNEFDTANNSTVSATVDLYEVNGISLADINRIHEVQDFGFDHYTIDISNNAITSDVTATADSIFGGDYVYASENILVDAYQLMLPTVSYPKTNISTRIKFATGSSLSGNQIPFVDKGYGKTELVDRVEFTTPRLIASQVNETEHMGGNKSSSVEVTLSTQASNLTPILDLERKSITAYGNRVDNISTSSDVDSTSTFIPATAPEGDSSESVYITKRVQLKNPATSIKVLFDAVVNSSASVEVMYKVLRSDDSSDFDELGWNYFNTAGETDTPVTSAVDRTSFKEHEYTENDIPEFISFSIKIKMKGVNSSEPPLLKDLRAIALAV